MSSGVILLANSIKRSCYCLLLCLCALPASGRSDDPNNPTQEVCLALVVGFPDDPNTPGDDSYVPRVDPAGDGTAQSYITRICNEVGFDDSSSGSTVITGSVFDYYKYHSLGAYELTHEVMASFMLDEPYSYYANINATLGSVQGARQIARDAVEKFKASGRKVPNNVTTRSDNNIVNISVIAAGSTAMIQGLATSFAPSRILLDREDGSTVYANTYNVSNFFTRAGEGPIAANSPVPTLIHELGHALFEWPDLYDVDGGSSGIGNYCLMSFGNSNGVRRVSAPPSAYLKVLNGWADVIDVATTDELTVSIPSTGNVVYRVYPYGTLFTGEYFLIENIGDGNPYYAAMPDKGIAIWHVDESASDNTDQQATTNRHFRVSLVQADGNLDMENDRSRGDSGDLYDNSTQSFTPTSVPSSDAWYVRPQDTTGRGLRVEVLSAPGANMTVKFGGPNYTLSYSAGANGSLVGDTTQVIAPFSSGFAVRAVPDPNYIFSAWSDGVLTELRDELDVQSDITVVANFVAPPAPGFSGLSLNTDEEDSITISLDDFLLNFTYLDEQVVSIVEVSPRSSLGGSVELTQSDLVYTPAIGMYGDDRFSVTVADALGATTVAVVQVVIDAADPGASPVPVPPAIELNQGGAPLLSFDVIADRDYVLQRSADLLIWDNLTDVTADNEGKVIYTDTAALPDAGFYRLARPE